MKAVDGTGAGDAFAAGFLVGYLKKWDLYETGRFMNACGAMCSSYGANDGVGNFDEVMDFVRKHS